MITAEDIRQQTTLPPETPDDGDARRRQRGMAIATLVPIRKSRAGYKVPAQSGYGTHFVIPDPEDPYCSCPDFEERLAKCKHIYAVEFLLRNAEAKAEAGPQLLGTNTRAHDGQVHRQTALETRAPRQTYGQNWPAYNAAQAHEQEHFVRLLGELCDTVPQPPQSVGRPRLLISDVLFGIALKVYSTFSGRRVLSSFRDAEARGLLDKAPSFTSTFRYLEDPDVTPLLKSLIEQSALPLRSVEADFAVDSSGFSSSVYDRWFDHKYGRELRRGKWVKAHLICGVHTNIVTSIEATPAWTNDSPYLEPLVRATARNFDISEVSADKAYLSRKNLAVIDEVGGAPYIPFKIDSISHGTHEGLWDRAYHFYNLHRAEFLAHYHKRSNVETTFSMIKAKFGGAVRARTPVAQVNEVLAKVLCHNICVLIQSAYELGVAPIFGPGPGIPADGWEEAA